MAPAPAALLFRLAFLSFVPGDIGLFSAALLPFRVGEVIEPVLISGDVASFEGIGGFVWVWELVAPGSRDLERMKEPGSPIKGFSSIYSLPYREERLYDSARSCKF